MRAKQIWDVVPLPMKAKLMWERLTFSRLTIFYLVFSILHCVSQVIFQTKAFMINKAAASTLYDVILQGNATLQGFAVYGSQQLKDCATVPDDISTSSCTVVWPLPQADTQAQASDTAAASYVSTSVTSATTTSTPIPSTAIANTSLLNGVQQQAVRTGSPTTVTKTAVALPSATLLVSNLTQLIQDLDNSELLTDSNVNVVHSRSLVGEVRVSAPSTDTANVTVTGIYGKNSELSVPRTCLTALNYPADVLFNTKREDVVFICFQVWVLGMSIVAVLNESIPHIVASLLTHLLATAWGAFQILNTADFRRQFTALATNGACRGNNLLPTYWNERRDMEIPSLALNAAALLISAFLSWRLIKLFGWQTFKRVGASMTINRIYKAVLIFSIAIQLAVFFIVTTIGLWIDQLYNGIIGHLSPHQMLFEGLSIGTLILMVPWLATGWYSVRREARFPMLVFLGLSVMYLACWGGMFAVKTFRWTYMQWRFFSVITTASVFLTVMTFALGIYCRVNFGKGLIRYLNAQEPLAGDDFEPAMPSSGLSDPEKVDFPSEKGAIPTFSAAFGSGQEVPLPSQMFPKSVAKGPRFFRGHPDSLAIAETAEPGSMEISANDDHVAQMPQLSRQASNESDASFDSSISRSKRWIIE